MSTRDDWDILIDELKRMDDLSDNHGNRPERSYNNYGSRFSSTFERNFRQNQANPINEDNRNFFPRENDHRRDEWRHESSYRYQRPWGRKNDSYNQRDRNSQSFERSDNHYRRDSRGQNQRYEGRRYYRADDDDNQNRSTRPKTFYESDRDDQKKTDWPTPTSLNSINTVAKTETASMRIPQKLTESQNQLIPGDPKKNNKTSKVNKIFEDFASPRNASLPHPLNLEVQLMSFRPGGCCNARGRGLRDQQMREDDNGGQVGVGRKPLYK